jgi:hypothetical protein
MKFKKACLAGLLVIASTSSHAQFSLNKLTGGDELPTLTSSNKKGIGFASVSIPYLNSVNYFGYIDKDASWRRNHRLWSVCLYGPLRSTNGIQLH